MFFQEQKNLSISDIDMPVIFFEQILPVIDSAYIKVYLYGYYIYTLDDQKELIDNRELARRLKVPVDEVIEAWDFLESCGLVKKHKNDSGLVWDFSVEFIDLKSLYLSKAESKSAVNTDELIMMSKNSDLKNMFDSIESITKRTLNYNEIRTINEFMKEYSVPKELVVEAFSFCVTIKKIKTVSGALSILRTWHLDGIRNADDLKQHLEKRHHKYSAYRSILSMLGEYRLPTKAEQKVMDTWMDDMNFSLEVIELAFERSTAIKNPNMNYVNGILKNWHAKYLKKNHIKPAEANTMSPLEFRTSLLGYINIDKQNLSDKEDKMLSYMHTAYGLNDLISCADHIRNEDDEVSVEAIFNIMSNPNSESGKAQSSADLTDNSKIAVKDIMDIIDEKGPRNSSKPKSPSRTAASSAANDDLESKLLQKRKNSKG